MARQRIPGSGEEASADAKASVMLEPREASGKERALQ